MNRSLCLATLVASIGLVGCTDNVDHYCNDSGHACNYLGEAGQLGFNGDGHAPKSTMLYWTMNTMFASDGTPWFIDWNNHIVRKIADNKVVTVVGWDDPIFPGDGDPMIPGDAAEKTPQGDVGTNVQLNHPTQLFEMPDGTITIVAWHDHKLRSIDPTTGNVRIIAGAGAGFKGDGGPLSSAVFNRPTAMTMDEANNIYIVDQVNQRIRMVTAANPANGGIITTMVGTGSAGFSGDSGPCVNAQISFQAGDNPEPGGGIAYANGVLYIADTGNNRIRQVNIASGIITTLAGTGATGYSGDGGDATQATLYDPHALRIGPDGDLYVADTDNGVIRAINLTTNVIRTVAGIGGDFGLDKTDDLLATATHLYRPFGVDFDAAGNMYISDSLNSRTLRVAQ